MHFQAHAAQNFSPVYCKIASKYIYVNVIVQNTFKVGHDDTGKLNGVIVTYYREVGYLKNPGGGDYLYGYLDNGNVIVYVPGHEISNNVVCATRKASD